MVKVIQLSNYNKILLFPNERVTLYQNFMYIQSDLCRFEQFNALGNDAKQPTISQCVQSAKVFADANSQGINHVVRTQDDRKTKIDKLQVVSDEDAPWPPRPFRNYFSGGYEVPLSEWQKLATICLNMWRELNTYSMMSTFKTFNPVKYAYKCIGLGDDGLELLDHWHHEEFGYRFYVRFPEKKESNKTDHPENPSAWSDQQSPRPYPPQGDFEPQD